MPTTDVITASVGFDGDLATNSSSGAGRGTIQWQHYAERTAQSVTSSRCRCRFDEPFADASPFPLPRRANGAAPWRSHSPAMGMSRCRLRLSVLPHAWEDKIRGFPPGRRLSSEGGNLSVMACVSPLAALRLKSVLRILVCPAGATQRTCVSPLLRRQPTSWRRILRPSRRCNRASAGL